MKYGFGVDLGGTTVKIAYFDQTGLLLRKWEIPTDISCNGKNILPDIADSILQFLSGQNIPRRDILGIGIGVPGPVAYQKVVNGCENLGWGVLDVAQSLSDLTGFPVKAGNDATLAALGEYYEGDEACKDMILITLGTGVGAGIISEGRLLQGAFGGAGEIGHIPLRKSRSVLCGCGNYDCAEQYCSATGIVRTAKAYLREKSGNSSLLQLDDLTCKDIFTAAGNGDSAATEILELVYDDLALLTATVCNVLNPQIVLFGGGVSHAGETLIDGITRYLPRYIFHGCAQVKLGLARLGNDAGVYGAFKLISENL